MSWLVILALAGAVFVLLTVVLKAPRVGWEAILAALLLGLAGYGLQGNPGLAGAPHEAPATSAGVGADMVAQRLALAGDGAVGDAALIPADAFMRHGEYAEAAALLRQVVAANPQDGEAWLALGNALVAHGEGALSPAAAYAYAEARVAEPEAPGPRYFLGLALATSGRLGAARAQWAELLARARPAAPWRGDVAGKLRRLDRLIALTGAGGQLR